MPTVSLVIQGPIHRNTITNLEMNIQKVDQVVLSTWKPNDDVSHTVLEKVRAYIAHKDNVHLVVNTQPGIPSNAYNPANLFLQTESTYLALERVTSDFSIKCRSDEYFNLSPFLSTFFEDPARPLFLNFIIRPSSYMDFHLSDHLFAGSTCTLRSSITLLRAILVGVASAEWDAIVATCPPPEVLLTYCLLVGQQITVESIQDSRGADAVNLLDANFRIYDLDKLSPYEVRANTSGIGAIQDFKRFSHIWCQRNTIDIRRYASIRDLAPTSTLEEFVRQVVRRFFHNRIIRAFIREVERS